MLTRCFTGGMGEYFEVIESEVQKNSKFGIGVVIWSDQFWLQFWAPKFTQPTYPLTKNIFWTDSILTIFLPLPTKNWNFS